MLTAQGASSTASLGGLLASLRHSGHSEAGASSRPSPRNRNNKPPMGGTDLRGDSLLGHVTTMLGAAQQA
jgi:hypothetical protein